MIRDSYRPMMQSFGLSVWMTHDPARHWMLVFKAYHDASGSQGDRKGVLVVVGVLATEQKHIRFEREWREALRDAGVDSFHMKSFAAFRSPFEDFRNDEPRRIALLKSLIRVIKRNANKGFSVALDLAAFQEVANLYKIARPLNRAYPLAAAVCQDVIDVWLKRKHPGCGIQHIIEAGDTGQGAYVHLARNVGKPVTVMPKIDPVSGERLAQFEAADLLAWERHKLFGEALESDRLRLRAPIMAMRKHLPHDGRVMDKAGLIGWCEKNEFPKRSLD